VDDEDGRPVAAAALDVGVQGELLALDAAVDDAADGARHDVVAFGIARDRTLVSGRARRGRPGKDEGEKARQPGSHAQLYPHPADSP
jgi:hypothetical protein